MAVWRSDEPVESLTWAPSENAKNTGGGGVYESRTDEGHVTVPAVAFDRAIDSLGAVDVLKIDAEGSEYPILMTSQRLDRIGLIVGEWHRVPSDLNGGAPAEWTPEGLFAHLAQHGFHVTHGTTNGSDGRLGHFRATRPRPLASFERSVFSGSGEDGVIEEIFQRIAPTTRFAVEFGANDGVWLSNTRNLVLHHGWNAFLIEGKQDLALKAHATYIGQNVGVLHAKVLPSNIEALLVSASAPPDLDFLSIDIDSFDWYVWHAIQDVRPKCVCIEYNASFPPPEERVVPYDPGMFDAAVARLGPERCDDYFGASLQSMYLLGKSKGYELVYCTSDGVNAFFVDAVYAERFEIPADPVAAFYRLPTYGVEGLGRAPNGRGHERSSRW
jgi:hypothetical protein